jgi:hypothetical protein
VKNGKPQADVNCFDDVVMWDAICIQMNKERRVLPSNQKAFSASLDHLL